MTACRGQPLRFALGLVLALSLAPGSTAAPDANSSATSSPDDLSFSVSAGFSGWANPLPNYPLILQPQENPLVFSPKDEDAGAWFNDLSITPVRIRVTNTGRVNVPFDVQVSNHASPLVPSALLAAWEVVRRADEAQRSKEESGSEDRARRGSVSPGDSGVSDAAAPGGGRGGTTFSTVSEVRQGKFIARKQSTQDFFVPVAVFPRHEDLHPAGLKVELSVQGQPVGEASALVRFLPTGSVYSALVAQQPDERLLLDEVKPSPALETETSTPGFRFDHGIVTVPHSMLGPNHTVLRHFQYLLVSADSLAGLPRRERQLLGDAVLMGSRLAVYEANSGVDFAGRTCQPKAGLTWQVLGFGQVAVSTLGLASLREALAHELAERALEAYRYFAQRRIDSLAPASWRSRMMSELLGETHTVSYGWVFSGERGLLEVNPVWAYEYAFSPALAQPLEQPELHWEHLWTPDVFAEKENAKSGVERRKMAFPIALQKAFMGDSLRSLAAFILCSALVLIVAVGLSLWLGRSRLLVILVTLAVCGFAGSVFLLERARTAPGITDYVELSFVRGASGASVVEREILLGFFQAASQPLDFGLPLRNLVLKRVAPVRQHTFEISSQEEFFAGLDRLSVNPFLVSEVALRGVGGSPPLFDCKLKQLADGWRELRLTNATGSDLKFVQLALHGELLDLGPMPPGQELAVIVPPPGTRPVDSESVELTRVSLTSFRNRVFGPEYSEFGSDTAQVKAEHALGRAGLAMLPYELTADRERIYVLALRSEGIELAVHGVGRPPAAAAELILYCLQ